MIRRGLGWVPDSPDSRDHLLDAPLLSMAAAAPVACDLGDIMPDVMDQGPDATCVAQAGAACVYAAHALDPDVPAPYELLSRKGVHWLCRHESGTQDHNVGTSLRTFFRVLNARGFCRETHWDHDRPLTKRPSVHAAGMMIDQRSRGLGRVRYERIGDEGAAKLGALKASIAAGMPVVAGFYVGDAFFSYQAGEVLGPPADGEDVGGHAMVIYGYAPHDSGTKWLVRNSHGKRYGNGGDLWVSDSYALTVRDPWVARAAPPFSDTYVA